MNRDIKFRGKIKGKNEWVIGDLIQSSNSINKSILPINEEWMTNSRPVYPDSIGQFTGLHDKNGVEIYEGDIVGTSYRKKGVVVYDDARACFILHDSQHFNVQLFQELPSIMIIGNIFENPELLEK